MGNIAYKNGNKYFPIRGTTEQAVPENTSTVNSSGGRTAVIRGMGIEKMAVGALNEVIQRYPYISIWRPHGTYRSSPDKIFCRDPEDNVINPDFVLYGLSRFPDGLAGEIKFQSASGSGDEKPEHLIANIIHSFPCPAIVIIAYDPPIGAQPGLVRKFASVNKRYMRLWKEHVDTGGTKFVGVFSLPQFMVWINKEADEDAQKRGNCI